MYLSDLHRSSVCFKNTFKPLTFSLKKSEKVQKTLYKTPSFGKSY